MILALLRRQLRNNESLILDFSTDEILGFFIYYENYLVLIVSRSVIVSGYMNSYFPKHCLVFKVNFQSFLLLKYSALSGKFRSWKSTFCSNQNVEDLCIGHLEKVQSFLRYSQGSWFFHRIQIIQCTKL